MKRWRARARGRVARIRKRTCHITVALAERPEPSSRRRSSRERGRRGGDAEAQAEAAAQKTAAKKTPAKKKRGEA